MNKKGDESIILHAHLDDQLIGEDLGTTVTGIGIRVFVHIVQTTPGCTDEDEVWAGGLAEKSKCGLVQQHDGEVIDHKDLSQLLERHILNSIEFGDTCT